MKRLAIAALIVVLLLATVLVVFFSASTFRVENQGYFVSLHDFLFLLHSHNRQALGWEQPALTDRRYARVMAHARKTAHREVRERVAWSLAQWGDAVVPRLIEELEAPAPPGRVIAAAEALAMLKETSAVPALSSAIERARVSDRWLLVSLIDAAGELGPEMAEPLVSLYRSIENSNEIEPYTLLDAIGKTGAGVDFLLEEIARADSDERIMELLWPLAFTRDERAARALLEHLHHMSLDVRRRARDSTAQSMGAAAIEPAVDFLSTETDDVLRNWVLDRILSQRAAAESPRAVELLVDLADDPVVGREARYALARSRSEKGVEALLERAERLPPRWLLENVGMLGDRGLPLVAVCLEHENAYVRRMAMTVLVEMRTGASAPLLAKATSDSDAWIRRTAREALEQDDLNVLAESFRRWLSDRVGRQVSRVRPPNREGVHLAMRALSFVHWVGLAVSALVGCCLLAGWLRAFDPFRLALVLQFLLVEGILGDFFFFANPSLYRWATASRMVLLLGLLFLRDDPLPGETRGRVDRLAVRSLWILVPLLLLVGTSLFAETLRLALRDFDTMKWALVLLAATTLLLIEQAFLPWDLFPRGGRVERALTFLLSTFVVGLFAVPLVRFARASFNEDRGVLSALMLVPLCVALVFHLRQARLLAPPVRPSRRRGHPPGRLRVVDRGDSLLIKLRQPRRFRGLPLGLFCAGFLVCSWLLASTLGVARGGAPAMLLVMILAVVGTALGALVVSGLASGVTVQVRDGALRWATTYFGGAFGPSSWYRKLRLPAFGRGTGLTAEERSWIVRLLVVPLAVLVLAPTPAHASEPTHPTDHVRILESEMPDRWALSMEALLGEEDALALHVVSSVVRRVASVDPPLQRRVARALGKEGGHPLAQRQLRDWVLTAGEPLRGEALQALLHHRGVGAMDTFAELLAADVPEGLQVMSALVDTLRGWERLRTVNFDVLIDPVMLPGEGSAAEVFDRRYRAACRGLLESEDAAVRTEAEAIVQSLEISNERPADPPTGVEDDETTSAWYLALLAWLPAVAGTILFLWGFNLAALGVRIRLRPLAKAKSVALGPVALEGTIEPKDRLLQHPMTGERCVYFAGAETGDSWGEFFLEDDTGRVVVRPDGAVLLSDDGVLVPGERIQLVGLADRDARGDVVIRKDDRSRPLYQKLVHRLVEALFGFGRETAVTRMLFSDPRRCFWIWDDLSTRPLSRGGDVLWLAVGFTLAGAWMIVFSLAAAGVIDAGL